MNKEFISYEQALALKELGFDEECLGWYPNNAAALSLDGVYIGKPSIGSYKLLAYAPLKQQVFRWFRDEHDLFGNIDLHVSTPVHWYVRIDNMTDNDYLYHSEDEDLKWSTYEEAEQACLDKLIEIIKHEQKM
jgi:hypothetical protein